MGYSFWLTARVLLYVHHHTDRITHTTAFVIPIVEHWLEREIDHRVHSMKDRSDDPSHHERTLLPRSYISLPKNLLIFNCLIAYLSIQQLILYLFRSAPDDLYDRFLPIRSMRSWALMIGLTILFFFLENNINACSRLKEKRKKN